MKVEEWTSTHSLKLLAPDAGTRPGNSDRTRCEPVYGQGEQRPLNFQRPIIPDFVMPEGDFDAQVVQIGRNGVGWQWVCKF